jgi:hypothetical protein
VDGPPVYVPVERQLVWQVRSDGVTNGELRISTGIAPISKRVTAGSGLSAVSEVRAGSVWQFFLHPGEWPFSSEVIDSIKIGYRPATVFHAPWSWWFGLSSLLGAGLLALLR